MKNFEKISEKNVSEIEKRNRKNVTVKRFFSADGYVLRLRKKRNRLRSMPVYIYRVVHKKRPQKVIAIKNTKNTLHIFHKCAHDIST